MRTMMIESLCHWLTAFYFGKGTSGKKVNNDEKEKNEEKIAMSARYFAS